MQIKPTETHDLGIHTDEEPNKPGMSHCLTLDIKLKGNSCSGARLYFCLALTLPRQPPFTQLNSIIL